MTDDMQSPEAREDAVTFRDPINILPMGGGYDWRDFTGHGPYFLCKDGLPLRDSSKWNTEGWRIAAVEVGREGALTKFAEYVAGLEEKLYDIASSEAEKAYRS